MRPGSFACFASALCVLVVACAPRGEAPAAALGCEPRSSWPAEELTRWAAGLLLRPDLRAADVGDVEVHYAGILSAEGCVTAATLAWKDRLGGGLVLAFPDGRVLTHGGFEDARAPISAGPGRVGFLHTVMRGTSALESRWRMVCANAFDQWVDCLDVVTDQTIYPSWNPLSSDDRLRLRSEHRASVAIDGDSVLITGRRLYREFNGREPTSEDLGPLVFRLPAPSR